MFNFKKQIQMNNQKPTQGRTVQFFPGTGTNKTHLPSAMQTAPAIVTVAHDDAKIDAVVLVQEDRAGANPTFNVWGVPHKTDAVDPEAPYWDWYARE